MNQSLPLIEQLRNLEHLQELDLKIDQLKKNRSSLPAGLKNIDDNLTKLRNTSEAKKNALIETEKVHRQTLAALDLNKDRLSRANTKLETVQNSQEFQAANKEIEQLKKLNTSLEDQSRKSSLDLETLRKEIDQLGEQVQKIQKDRDTQAATVSGQDSQFNTEISKLMGEREQYTPKVEVRLLSQYDRIRAARAGLGIVPALGGRCKGCNMVVPPQLYNEIQRGSQLHNCPSCNRILFVPVASEGQSTGNVAKMA